MKNQRTIEETEKEIAEEFSLFDSWDDKYEYILTWVKNWLHWRTGINLMKTG